MLFEYKAIDTDGNRTSGQIDAADRDAAISALQRRDLVVTSIRSAGESESVLQMNITLFERVSNKEVVILSRQIATLFSAEVSALRVFQLLQVEVENPKLQRILGKISDDLQGGETISDALAKHDDVFDTFYVNMVRSGEESGKLNDVFQYLADHLERMYELTTKARNALIYPAFVLAAFVAVMGILFTFVFPQIKEILESTGQDLPIYTEIVLAVSTFFANFWLLVLAALVVAGVIVWKYVQTQSGRRRFDRFKLSIPYIGDLFMQLQMARIANNLDAMLASGIPMVRGLEVTRDVLSNTVYREILADVVEEVRGGTTLSEALSVYDDIPGIMTQIIKVGEETGQLSELLSTIADFYEREVRNSIDTLISLIEPALILLLGVGVGVLLASVLMPIYNLASGF